MQYILVLLFAVYGHPVYADNIEFVEVQYKDGIYTLDLEFLINARQDAVWKILTDYEHLDRLNASIIESTVLERVNNKIKQKIITSTCIVFFCFEATLVELIEEKNKRLIITRIDPALSDYHFGKSRWELTPEGHTQTRINLHKQIQPAFWVPPFIGPVVIKHKIHTEAQAGMKQLKDIILNE